ncbi:hypothetical protein L1F30_00840 [Simiduia sp. 21SJ11W-1]|uniref:hypothetical protein n=1 Tax=Simiduia sp. 21SJ11W-1 TaxID=2909669 RepID=UPI0020A09D10|nr:hypothetical protein [Simiduia sp. 21SJ11W-1]UTA48101.1 hypothetical protein L1F30_00840 [Simiduia sp. 21SJ11W-1]
MRLAVVDATGRPAPNVVVVAPDVAFERPEHAVFIDQRNMQFVPHVIVVPLGQPVYFPNSDKTRHQVYSFSAPNNFELKLYRQHDAPPVSFSSVGVVELGCNIHDAMKGYIYVTQATSYGVTDEQGLLTLPGPVSLPVNLHIWHPVMGARKPQSLLLTANAPIQLSEALPEKAKQPSSSLRERLQQFKQRDD